MATNICCQALPSHPIKITPPNNLKKVRSVCRPSVCFNWLFIRIRPFLKTYSSFVSISLKWPGWVGRATWTRTGLWKYLQQVPFQAPRQCPSHVHRRSPHAASHTLSVFPRVLRRTGEGEIQRALAELYPRVRPSAWCFPGCHHPHQKRKGEVEQQRSGPLWPGELSWHLIRSVTWLCKRGVSFPCPLLAIKLLRPVECKRSKDNLVQKIHGKWKQRQEKGWRERSET